MEGEQYKKNPYYPQAQSQASGQHQYNPNFNQNMNAQDYYRQQDAYGAHQNPAYPAYPTNAPAQMYRDEHNVKSFDGVSDEEGNGNFMDNFDKLKGDDERQGFVVKVFGIMCAQVIATVLFTGFVISDKGRMDFCLNNLWLYLVCLIVTIGIMYALICIQSAARKVPTNYILLGLFTLCESYIVATIASMYDPRSVFLAAVYAVGLFTILTLYACCTKGDIGCMGPIIMVSMGLGFLTFILYFMFPSDTMHLIFCWVGLIITCVYVIYDVYLITEKHGLDYDDYIIGALLIYTDLISLFIYILSIIGDRN